MGCGLGWFVGPQLLLCDGLDWVSRLLGWVGWVGLKKLDPRTTLGYLSIQLLQLLKHYLPMQFCSVCMSHS